MPLARNVTLLASFDGQDWERFGSNEYPPTSNQSRTVFLTDDQPQGLLNYQQRWGGECRSEFVVLAQRLTGGDVRIYGELKLYEGTSEDTMDLDGVTQVDFIAPRSASTPYEVLVRNNDEDDDDWARVRMMVTNFPYVPEE